MLIGVPPLAGRSLSRAATPRLEEQGERVAVAVLGLEASGLASKVAATLSSAVVQSLAQLSRSRPVPGKSLEEIKLVFGCMDERVECMAAASRSLGARKLLWGSVAERGDAVVLRLSLLDVSARSIKRSAPVVLSRSDVEGPMVAVQKLVRALLGEPLASIRIRGRAKGALVRVDGRVAGTIGEEGLLLAEVAPGKRIIVLARGLEVIWQRELDVPPGAELELDVDAPAASMTGVPTLEQIAGSEQSARAGQGWRVAFWTVLALAVGAGIAIVPNALVVRSATDDKEQYFRDHPEGDWRGGCDAASLPDDLDRICARGARHALITNVLIGSAAALGVGAGVLAFKAWSSGRAATTARTASPSVPRLSASAGPENAKLGVGVSLDF